jgi:uncharacterized protein
MYVLTKKVIDEVLISEGEFEISLDLGRTLSKVKVVEKGLFFEGKKLIDFVGLSAIKLDDHTCYVIEDGKLKKVEVFSEKTNKLYKLVPTNTVPTLQISGIFMHRHMAMDPMFDTMLKMREIRPIKGKILDTCCGLGYTAIFSAQKCDTVVTCEKDKNVQQICKYNPFSEELYWNKKIKIELMSCIDYVHTVKENTFDRIIHDPPSMKIAGELYSDNFYQKLYRVLKVGGIIYHYTGLPESKSHGRNLKNVKVKEDALGVTAKK